MTQKIFMGLASPLKTCKISRGCLKGPWESQYNVFVVSNSHGATKRDLGEIRRSRGVPKEILKTSGTYRKVLEVGGLKQPLNARKKLWRSGMAPADPSRFKEA